MAPAPTLAPRPTSGSASRYVSTASAPRERKPSAHAPQMIERSPEPAAWSGAKRSGQSKLVAPELYALPLDVRKEMAAGEALGVLEMNECVVERHGRVPAARDHGANRVGGERGRRQRNRQKAHTSLPPAGERRDDRTSP